MILITGASGKTGKAVIKTLSQVESVCAFVRDKKHVDILKSLGSEKVFIGDLEDKSALLSATKNIRAIYHICPNMNPHEVHIGKIMLDIAKQNGVEHFVYHSVLHPQIEIMNHHWQKMRVEEMIFESGIPFTILQPAPYMQNLLANWKSIVENGILKVPYSIESKFSFIDLENLAEVAKIVLTEPNHKNAIYELSGTMPMSHIEVAEIFSKVLEREVKAEKMEIRDWRLGVTGSSEYALENLVRMFEYYDKWGLAGNSNVLKWILKRESNSLEGFVDRINN
ncbi:MAG: NmrA family NAD(P)-binding protein [Anaerolineales bacterium]|nr:NmrA family NAD(P)-binding protein [Anaerolineales bacterium]